MRTKNSWIVLALLACAIGLLAISPAAAQTEDPPAETTMGNYVVKQSIEMGYRNTQESGPEYACPVGSPGRNSAGNCLDPGLYDTFVNLRTGVRVLDQSFSLDDPQHHGLLFDDLSVSSVGWGGDPYEVGRATVSKGNLYNFTAQFRRDQNYFDYDLLDNPLNPLSLVPAPDQSPTSPHVTYNTRRMTDLAFNLLPRSVVGVRLGYSRVRTDGPAVTTTESSDSPLLFQEVDTYTNNFQLGVDFRVLPKTTISYDQFWQHYRGDTTYNLFQTPFVTTTGLPVDIGTTWGPDGATPACLNAAGQVIAGGSCYVYQAYNRANPYRTRTPTEQISLRSQAISHVDLNARFNYSASTLTSPYYDLFQGYTRGGVIEQIENGTNGTGKRVSDTADFGATFDITDRTRFLYTFRFENWRMPAGLDFTTLSWSGTTPTATLPSAAGTPASSTSSVAYADFLGDNKTSHEFEVERDFTRAFGGRAGFRYSSDTIREQGTEVNLATGAVSGLLGGAPTTNVIPIHEDTGLAGLWYRPNEKLRASADVEFTTADNFEFRIEPRRQLQYRARTTYKPVRWAVLSASGNFLEQRNNIQEIGFNAHNRNAGFTSTFLPDEKLNFELSYNYNNVQSNSFVCFEDSTVPLPPGSFASTGICATGNPALGEGGSALNAETYGTFANRVHFGEAAVMWTPVPRVTTDFGYSIVSSNGMTSIFDPPAPSGSLQSNFHRPLAGIQIEVAKNWFARFGYNFYDYHESPALDSFPDIYTRQRDFHTNGVLLSLKYAF